MLDTIVAATRSGRQQTLTEACAPVFLYLTTFRRNAATSGHTIQELQSALQRELERVRAHCEQDRRLHPLFERVWYALVAMVDQAILSSAWPQRTGWSMNLLETRYFATSEGGARFYVLVEQVLADGSEAAPELAELLFHCMGLGFQGELLGERRELEQKRRQLYDKARATGIQGGSLAPDAYGRNASRDFTKLPTVGMLRLVVVAVGAVLFAYLAGEAAASFRDHEHVETIEQYTSALRGEQE